MRAVLVLALFLQLSGCSILFVEGPKNAFPASPVPPYCTTSKGWVGVDVTLMLINFGIAAAAGSTGREEDRDTVVLSILDGIIYAISASVGNDRVNKCRKAIGEWSAAHQLPAVPVAPQPGELSTTSKPPPPVPVAIEEPPPVEDDRRYFCSVSHEVGEENVSVCGVGEGICVAQRDVLHAGKQMSPCVEADAVTCVDAIGAAAGAAVRWCFATVGACTSKEAELKANAIYRDVGVCTARSRAE